jgi:hypothetical protein
VTSRATVATSTPDRYGRQLVAHLGRRVLFETACRTSTARIAGGVGRITVSEDALILEAEATDTGALRSVQDVLGRHLQRFARNNELVIDWDSPAGPDDDSASPGAGSSPVPAAPTASAA